MKRMQTALFMVLAFAVAGLAPWPVHAQSAGATIDSATGGNLVTVTVTAVPRHPGTTAELKAQDVLVYENRQRRPVRDWKLATAAQPALDLAILMDDSLASTIGLQMGDLRQFIHSLPATTRVAVAYAKHGDASIAQGFTTDRELAAKALRLPIGRGNEISSIYQSLADLVKQWPVDGNRRAVLMVSDGIDLYYGVVESQPSLNPNVKEAIGVAQRAGVTVYTIFANTAGGYSRDFDLVNNGQGSLGLLTSETGGEAFFQVLETPLAFAPYLQQFKELLDQQYLLTFEALPGASGYEGLHVTTEQPHLKLVAPARVYVPSGRSG